MREAGLHLVGDTGIVIGPAMAAASFVARCTSATPPLNPFEVVIDMSAEGVMPRARPTAGAAPSGGGAAGSATPLGSAATPDDAGSDAGDEGRTTKACTVVRFVMVAGKRAFTKGGQREWWFGDVLPRTLRAAFAWLVRRSQRAHAGAAPAEAAAAGGYLLITCDLGTTESAAAAAAVLVAMYDTSLQPLPWVLAAAAAIAIAEAVAAGAAASTLATAEASAASERGAVQVSGTAISADGSVLEATTVEWPPHAVDKAAIRGRVALLQLHCASAGVNVPRRLLKELSKFFSDDFARASVAVAAAEAEAKGDAGDGGSVADASRVGGWLGLQLARVQMRACT